MEKENLEIFFKNMLDKNDPDSNKCYEEFLKRSRSSEWYQYINGNTLCEINSKDGTLIMSADKDQELEFPVNIDMNISNRCLIGCPFCYQKCTKNGKEADIKKYLNDRNSFLYSLHSGTELAINGNEPLHENLIDLLKFCKKRKIFANLTVNEKTFIENKSLLQKWMNKGLIHGLGISPSSYSEELLDFASENSNVVIHTIVGITTQKQYMKLINRSIKILILGYKNFGRGIEYKKDNKLITANKENLKTILSKIAEEDIPAFISFDNLAIYQLNPRKLLKISDKEYDILFRGEDGHHTMFINLVNETYARNSIELQKDHHKLTNNIKDMFKVIKEGSN